MKAPQNMRDATRAAIRLAGWLLAKDIHEAPAHAPWMATGRDALMLIDKLEVVEDENFDRKLEELSHADGTVWLDLAEDGFFDNTDFVAHVLFYFDEAGYSGSPFVQHLLRAIDAADEDKRWSLAGAFPEYVGLWRACTSVEGGRVRLLAVMDRK